MSEARMDDEFARAVDDFTEQVAVIGRLQAEAAELMGTGTAARRRVTVVVNADGIAIDIKFASSIGDLEYDEIAEAITEASGKAVVDVARRRKELMAPVMVDYGEAPKVGDMLAAVDSLKDQLS
ncbi:YbaB/EbfC family nucleoid-associated protein [Nocardia sp. NPDC050175]|uniref:YbaB/EbfC family nucleoid-associated protein n=1 Tax=Nocardia sp. NPDC050175 TaxID=3364317 RepID=UPI003794F75C